MNIFKIMIFIVANTFSFPINATDESDLALRDIMKKIGNEFSSISYNIAILRLDRVSENAESIANHGQPPVFEKLKIFTFLGQDAPAFKKYDEELVAKANLIELASSKGELDNVVDLFGSLQETCIRCHSQFREPFIEHFYRK